MHPSKERRSSRSKTTTAQRIVTLPCGRSSPNSPINGSPPSQMSREGRNAHLRRGNRARKNCLPYWRKLSGGHVQEKLRSPTSRESNRAVLRPVGTPASATSIAAGGERSAISNPISNPKAVHAALQVWQVRKNERTTASSSLYSFWHREKPSLLTVHQSFTA